MFHALYTKTRAEQYLAQRQHAHLTKLAAEADRADEYCFTGLLLLFALACCCA